MNIQHRKDGVHLLLEDRGDGRVRIKDGALKEHLLLIAVKAEIEHRLRLSEKTKGKTLVTGWEAVEIAIDYAHKMDDVGSTDMIPTPPPEDYFDGMDTSNA